MRDSSPRAHVVVAVLLATLGVIEACGSDDSTAGIGSGADAGDAGTATDAAVSSTDATTQADASNVDANADADADVDADAGADAGVPRFSFFVTSYAALHKLSGAAVGFGGDLRFGELGAGAGLRGADKICTTIAETSMPGAGKKTWRAFLSVSKNESGLPINAIDRIGGGPWYDRKGRTFGLTLDDLRALRPTSADPAIRDDFPNEDGVPNHAPDGTKVANHDMLTGSDSDGKLLAATATCLDWTSATGSKATEGQPQVGRSFPKNASDDLANHWISSQKESGCAPGTNFIEMGPPNPSDNTVGSGGGYGGFYCFALTP